MAHPLVDQLHFTRSEWRRALDGVSAEDAQKRIPPLNCISWMVGHLAWQEQKYWVQAAKNHSVAPHLEELVATGQPASTPDLQEMWQAWHDVTRAADQFLETLTPESLAGHMTYQDQRASQSTGTVLLRVIYHYWYHIGESLAVRQMLNHEDLPEFVGDIGGKAPYRAG